MSDAIQLPAIVDLLEGLSIDLLPEYIGSLGVDECARSLSDWSLWSLPYQQLPAGPWRRWVMRGGRGTGKTHTGAATTHAVVRDRAKMRGGEVAIVGRTWTDARMIMVEGKSGLLATAPPDFRPDWHPGIGVLVWPNGIKGRIFASESPSALRGPNLAWVWADEVEHWAKNVKVWQESIEFALRIGWARAMLTSTPIKGSKLLRTLEDMDDTVVTRATSRENPYQRPDVVEAWYKYYEGTRIGRQELEGEIIDEHEGALWSLDMIDPLRAKEAPDMERIVVACDPAAEGPDTAVGQPCEHGIVACGRGEDGHGYFLEDKSRRGSPEQMVSAAIALYRRLQADAIVCEVNNGGDWIPALIRAFDSTVNTDTVRASRGKITRAEPVAAMAERKRIHHVGIFPDVEEQLCTREPGDKLGFDRYDAYVWGFTDLLLEESVGPLGAYT